MATPTKAALEARVEQLAAENQRLQSLVDDQANGVVHDWLISADAFATEVPNIHETFSWRVTRPLRDARTVQLKVAEIGLIPTMRIVTARLTRSDRRGRR
ncbi:hypothetical protein ACGGZK_16650 [Agromyces sp. MMS24-K17]|uniref:hypothetical protein n=1 Tax=Agromyces sp. MMS24-K17 TaxID=3372850 RepID=UPI00375466CE